VEIGGSIRATSWSDLAGYAQKTGSCSPGARCRPDVVHTVQMRVGYRGHPNLKRSDFQGCEIWMTCQPDFADAELGRGIWLTFHQATPPQSHVARCRKTSCSHKRIPSFGSAGNKWQPHNTTVQESQGCPLFSSCPCSCVADYYRENGGIMESP
jgi:hypothetical protein